MKMQPTYRQIPGWNPNLITNRLTALWAFNEAGLGGIMHAFKSPFTGIVVGGMAIILIALIADFSENKIKTILKATTIVLIVKALVSPHSPLPAYFAVGFQGIAGAVIFGFIPSHRLAAYILGIVGLSESALQKILTLTLIYGTSLWKSIDLFLNYVFQAFGLIGQSGNFPGSELLIALYLGLYLLTGIMVGYLAGIMPGELIKNTIQQDPGLTRQLTDLNQSFSSPPAPHIPWWRKSLFKLGAALAGIMIVLAFVNPELKGMYRAGYVLVRTCIVITVWYMLAVPVLTRLRSILLNKKRQRYANEVEQVLTLLPHLRGAAVILWRHSATVRFPARIKYFLLSLISYTLTCQPGENMIIKNIQEPISGTSR